MEICLNYGEFSILYCMARRPGYAFDSQDLTKGQKVTVNAKWTPTSANVQIGLIDNNTGYGLVKTVSNGSGSASFEITGDANFSIFIPNIMLESI